MHTAWGAPQIMAAEDQGWKGGKQTELNTTVTVDSCEQAEGNLKVKSWKMLYSLFNPLNYNICCFLCGNCCLELIAYVSASSSCVFTWVWYVPAISMSSCVSWDINCCICVFVRTSPPSVFAACKCQGQSLSGKWLPSNYSQAEKYSWNLTGKNECPCFQRLAPRNY